MIQVYVTDQLGGFGVGIAIINHLDGSTGYPARLMRVVNGHEEWIDLDPADAGAVIPPTLTLHGDLGRALLDGLARHYGGVEDARMLRKDYDAERARVDQLTGTLTGLVLQLTDRS